MGVSTKEPLCEKNTIAENKKEMSWPDLRAIFFS